MYLPRCWVIHYNSLCGMLNLNAMITYYKQKFILSRDGKLGYILKLKLKFIY